ncbi:MAG TPA: hypothetical protein VE979_05785 [Streptosporangiaceae bacterium]|nr:hypothetical protein [Streptosporangiaceae bacterium]
MRTQLGRPLTRFRTVPKPRTAGPGRPRRRRFLIAAAALLVAVFCAATARLFVWPERGMPTRVDAIVMLNGPGNRLPTALGLARAHRAPVAVISRGSPQWVTGGNCAPQIPGVRVICFSPDPATTQGEAEFAGRLARRYHWHSLVLVTTTPQDTRARLRMERCFPGSIYVMTAPLRAYDWPYALAYEWGATIKALVLQRSC